MRPDPDLTVSQWADAHRKLSSRASAEPGQYRTARTPYLREIMDALSPSHPIPSPSRRWAQLHSLIHSSGDYHDHNVNQHLLRPLA